MSFNKKHVPQLEELQIRHEKNGDEYLQSFEKADCLIGPTESINYIYKNLNRINGKTPEDNRKKIDEIISLLSEAHLKLSQLEISLAASEIKKVINYITIKQ